MSRLFKELSIIEWGVSSNKNIYVVNVRNVDKSQVQKKFESFEDVLEYYKSLDKKRLALMSGKLLSINPLVEHHNPNHQYSYHTEDQ